MTIIDDPRNTAAIAVHKALPVGPANGKPDPDEWTTTALVAVAVDLKPGTVSGLLRKLEDDALAERMRRGREVLWRRLAEPIGKAAGNGSESTAAPSTPRPGRTPRGKGSSAVSRAASRIPVAVGDCGQCGKPIVKEGRIVRHAHARTEAAADHKATRREVKAPMTGECSVCGSPMHKDGRSWVDERPKGPAHKPTAAVQRAGVGTRPKPVAESTMVAADLGADLKSRLVEHANAAGLSIPDAVRGAVEVYLRTARRGGKGTGKR